MPQARKTFNLQVSLEGQDECTVVSIVPFLISEFKPGIYPGRFVIQPCANPSKPEVLHVGTSVYFIPQFNGEEEMPAHVVKTGCKDIATSIVRDYLAGQMDVNEECQPGITLVPTKITSEQFTLQHAAKLALMKKHQFAWFAKLVQRADNDWNRYKRHTVVSDNQRFACRALGMERDWMTPVSTEVPVKCPACKTNCAPDAIVCMNCRCVLDAERYKKLTFAA